MVDEDRTERILNRIFNGVFIAALLGYLATVILTGIAIYEVVRYGLPWLKAFLIANGVKFP